MKMGNKVLITLLATSIAVGGTGCSAVGSQAVSSVKGATTSDDIWAPYEETLKITTILPENAGIQWREDDNYDNNPWYTAYKERFNIEVNNAWVSNDYGTKLNLTIADGNIPDVFVVNAQQLQQLQEADLIWDLTEVFDQYASKNIKGYVEIEADTFETAKFNDKLYAIPQLGYGIIDQPSQVWIRQDWKESLQLKDPETMDDLINIAKTFQKEFGGYAITENQSLESLNILATAWGAHPNIWLEQKDGSIGYGSIQPEMKEALKTYAQWYKEGIINPEFTIMDQQKMFQDIINGEVGISPFYQWWGYQPGPNVITTLGKEAIFDAYAVPTATGEPVKASISFGNIGYVVVNKKFQNPEAVMKLLNFYAHMLDDAYAEGEDQAFIDSLFNDAYPNIPYALRIVNPMTDYNLFVGVQETLEKGLNEDASPLGTGALKYYNSVDFIQNSTPEKAGDYLQMGSPKSAYSVAKKILDEDRIVKNKVWGRKPETLLNAGSTLDDLLKEGFTKIIVGEEPIEYFDTLVDNWKKAGGEQATKEVNELNN